MRIKFTNRVSTSGGGPCHNSVILLELGVHDRSGTTSHLRRSAAVLRPSFAVRSKSHLTMSSLDPPTYLTSIQNNIRARPISWEGAVRAKTITEDDLKKIKSIDKVRKEQRKQTIESDVTSFVTLLLGGDGSQSIFEAAAKRQDIIHYMLVLLGDTIDGTKSWGRQHYPHGALTPV